MATKVKRQGNCTFWPRLPVHQLRLEKYVEANNLTVSMSRRDNCHDNACTESFFDC